MDILFTRCAALDVHKEMVMACARTPEGPFIRRFSTMTEDLMAMTDWLLELGVTHVAMESTGSYWKPIYNLLEAQDLHVLVVNAKDVKNLPGRKTDIKDAEWLAQLLQHGLLKASYIPDRPQRELRELIRYRRSLVEERTREINRVQKVLEGANIKLSSVASNTLGVSARHMLDSLIQGEENPEVLAELAKGRLKAKKPQLKKALRGFMREHQRMMLETQLRHYDYLSQEIERLDQEVAERMRPFEKELERIETIPGVGTRTSQMLLAEIGTEMGQFPTAAHLCSWAGLAPGNNESAGKRKSGKTRKGNKKLRATLVEAARAAARTKNTYLSAQYHRIAARRGKNRAAVAVAHTILTIVYFILQRREVYKELGPMYYDERRKETVIKQSIKRLQALGVEVDIKHIA